MASLLSTDIDNNVPISGLDENIIDLICTSIENLYDTCPVSLNDFYDTYQLCKNYLPSISAPMNNVPYVLFQGNDIVIGFENDNEKIEIIKSFDKKTKFLRSKINPKNPIRIPILPYVHGFGQVLFGFTYTGYAYFCDKYKTE